ncbi:alpha/beta hydrolase [Amnibacterium sp. CER49]|uniref:alpha/beta fold hydrolase n=1 Tax=Amnibacterium sp. CER49 TaxID=3039161 RepID=UPI00244D55B0|nr:alpha/beta hydrolase [Amnibacterium sp. CER49]MDH2445526.1 alpha/beta hydrolase [Amnibacterium sp. CER49]
MPLQQLSLPDGRTIDLYVSGPDDGVPFVFHHGTPGSYVPPRALERQVIGRGLRFVMWSRPGYGGSTRKAGRSVVDVVADTEAVLAALGAARCVVGGRSGGGPHALACAARLRQAASVLVIAGVAPFEAEGLDFLAGMGQDNLDEFGAALEGEDALRRYLVPQREQLANVTSDEIVGAMASLLPEVDRAVITDEFGEDLAASFREAVRLGVDGWLDDDLAFVQPWGFELGEITVPVEVWQGSEDLMVPFAHGQWLAQRVPNAEVHLETGEGHLSIANDDPTNDAILGRLLAAV